MGIHDVTSYPRYPHPPIDLDEEPRVLGGPPWGTIGLLTPYRGGTAERVGARLRKLPPALVATIVTLVGYVFVSAILIGLGLLLTHVLLSGSIGRWDDGVERWFFLHRTPFWNTWTDIGSILAGAGTVVGIGVIAVVILLIRRHWPEVILLVCGLVAEIAAFLTIESTVPRPRPAVPKLDAVPSTSSYPSGHVAAAIVLYLSLAIIVGGRIRSAFLRVLVWIAAVALPIDVAASRMYRGMHHPTDVMAGALVGMGCLLFAVFATRAATATAEFRHGAGALVDLDTAILQNVR